MMIKAENIDKCDKCLKPNYKQQHTSFCGKCVANGYISAQQEMSLITTIRCSKCGYTVFQSRHVVFCSETCGGEETVTIGTPKMEDVAEEEAAKTKQKTEKQLKQLRKSAKQKAREQRRKENQKRKLEKNKQRISNHFLSPVGQVAPDPELVMLGPLGSVLREIIIQNTWMEEE